MFVGICVGSRFPFTQWIVSFAIDRDAPVVLRLLSGLLARPTRSAPFRRVPWSRECFRAFQNGILPAFLPLPPPRLCNEPFPPGRYFRVLAGGIYIYKLVSTRISVIGVTLCPAPPSGMGWGPVCTRVCVHWAPSFTRVYLPVLLCTCVRIYPAIYLSITHRCSSLPILHIQTLLACLVGGAARLSIIQ